VALLKGAGGNKINAGSINTTFLRNLVQTQPGSVSFNFCNRISWVRLADYKSEICGMSKQSEAGDRAWSAEVPVA